MVLGDLRSGFVALTVACLLVATSDARASFIGDTVEVEFDAFAANDVLQGSATVGAGVEFTGSELIYDYALDISESAFTLTISKPFSAGNFTGVFGKLVISGIDSAIDAVTFDEIGSSAFSSATPEIGFATPGTITIGRPSRFFSANTPASALSHSFTWNVDFAAVPGPAPLSLLMLAGLVAFGRRQRSA